VNIKLLIEEFMRKKQIETWEVGGKITLTVIPKVGQMDETKTVLFVHYASRSHWARERKKWKVDVRNMKAK
jgi:hypothetical protein